MKDTLYNLVKCYRHNQIGPSVLTCARNKQPTIKTSTRPNSLYDCLNGNWFLFTLFWICSYHWKRTCSGRKTPLPLCFVCLHLIFNLIWFCSMPLKFYFTLIFLVFLFIYIFLYCAYDWICVKKVKENT